MGSWRGEVKKGGVRKGWGHRGVRLRRVESGRVGSWRGDVKKGGVRKGWGHVGMRLGRVESGRGGVRKLWGQEGTGSGRDRAWPLNKVFQSLFLPVAGQSELQCHNDKVKPGQATSVVFFPTRFTHCMTVSHLFHCFPVSHLFHCLHLHSITVVGHVTYAWSLVVHLAGSAHCTHALPRPHLH